MPKYSLRFFLFAMLSIFSSVSIAAVMPCPTSVDQTTTFSSNTTYKNCSISDTNVVVEAGAVVTSSTIKATKIVLNTGAVLNQDFLNAVDQIEIFPTVTLIQSGTRSVKTCFQKATSQKLTGSDMVGARVSIDQNSLLKMGVAGVNFFLYNDPSACNSNNEAGVT